MCLDTCLDAGRLLKLLRFSAVILNPASIFQNCLISATTKCHINRNTRIIIILRVSVSIHTDANAQRHRHLISDVDGLYILQNRESLLLKLLNIFLLDDKEILVFLQRLYHTVHRTDVLVDLSVNQSCQQRTTYFLHTLKCLIVIVEVDQSGNHLLIRDLLQTTQHFCLIEQIDRKQFLSADQCFLFLLLGTAHIDRLNIQSKFLVPIRGMNQNHSIIRHQIIPSQVGKNGKKAFSVSFFCLYRFLK